MRKIGFYFFLKILFITERENKPGVQQAEGEGEAGSPLSREPDTGLDPRTLGSWPEPKVGTYPTEPPRCPPRFAF